MKLTTFTDYSLRVLMFVATAPGGRATIAEVAKAFSISENHLVKVAHLLGREGFLVNTRGRGGGLRLARDPRDLNIGRLVRTTEGEGLPAQCFGAEGGSACAIAGACRLARVLAAATHAFFNVLDETSLQDLVADRAALAAILHGPLPRAA